MGTPRRPGPRAVRRTFGAKRSGTRKIFEVPYYLVPCTKCVCDAAFHAFTPTTMAAFATVLQRGIHPPWAEHYVAFRALNARIVGQGERLRECGAVSAVPSQLPGDIADRDAALDAATSAIGNLLSEQLDAVDAFYCDRLATVTAQLDHCVELHQSWAAQTSGQVAAPRPTTAAGDHGAALVAHLAAIFRHAGEGMEAATPLVRVVRNVSVEVRPASRFPPIRTVETRWADRRRMISAQETDSLLGASDDGPETGVRLARRRAAGGGAASASSGNDARLAGS